MNKRLNVVYFGTPDFSVPSLDMLINHPLVNLKYVVSMPDRKSGRGQRVKSPETIEFAKKNKVLFHQTENINKDEDFLKKLQSEEIDIFIVLAFAQFLSSKVLNIPHIGCFNIHTSLLPKYRGAAPIQYAIINGDETTGVSIQKMVKKMDAGDIVLSHKLSIHPDETGGQLYTRLKFQAALSLNNFIENLSSDNLNYSAQDESKVSFAPSLNREDGLIKFKESTFLQLKNKIRALYPWPGTFFFLNEKRVKVFNIQETINNLSPGEVKVCDNTLCVGIKDKTIRVYDLQLEGKKRTFDSNIVNGLKSKRLELNEE